MGYYVKFLKSRKSVPRWKVQFISFRKDDTKNSKAKKPKREWDIPKVRWLRLGFHTQMTLLEAKARAKQLNSQAQLKRQEEQIKKVIERETADRARFESVLPSEFVADFEARFIRKRDSQTEQGQRATTRAYVLWRAAQRVIVSIGTDPTEWFFNTYQIYDFIVSQKWSARYAALVLKIVNLWGFYFSRKLARPFMPVPFPRGYERQRIADAQTEKTGVARASKPITPTDLEKIKNKINHRNYNWLYLSVWFDLRPKEVDLLRREAMNRIEILPNGRKILWVFQTKIVALPPEDRWKPIPILFEEQELGLKILLSGHFNRPLMKTMRRYFGPGITLYAGRKGFSDLMISKDQKFENISVWMGHSTVQRTWINYKSRRKFHMAGF